MNIEEAINYLEENLKNWKADRPDLGNSDIVEEVDKDYRAIETLLIAYEQKCNYIKENEIYKKNLFNNYEEISKELEKEKEKNKELKKENKKLNLVRLQYLVSSFPDTTETYKKYKKELDELIKEE